MKPSEIDQRYLEEVTASRFPVIEDEAPPLRIDIAGVGDEPAAPEEVKPELVAPVVAPESPSMTAYDPTVRERLAEFLQAGFESFGMERFQARRQAQSLVGGPSSNLPLQLGVADIVPFLGTGLQTQEAGRMLEDAAEFAQKGEYGEAAISAAVGALGLVPGAAGTVKAARQVGEMANVAGDKAVQAITGNPQATAMGALEAAGQLSPVSNVVPGLKAQVVQPIKDDSRLLMPAFLGKTKTLESGFIKLNSPIKMKDGSTISGFESADQRIFYGRDKNGVDFNVPREYINPDDFVSSRDGNKTMEKIKANLVESRGQGLTIDVEPPVSVKLSNKKIGEAFNRLVKDARDDFEEVMSNWQSGVFLNDDKDKLITYPGRDQAFSRGKEGGKITVTKKEMIDWLMSDGPFDENVYGPNIKNDEQWVAQIERLRDVIKGEE